MTVCVKQGEDVKGYFSDSIFINAHKEESEDGIEVEFVDLKYVGPNPEPIYSFTVKDESEITESVFLNALKTQSKPSAVYSADVRIEKIQWD